MLPVISKVSVFNPNLIVAMYSFSKDVIISTNLVYFPVKQTRTPDAKGSRVPVCPIFLLFKILHNLLTTSLLVINLSLFTTNIWFKISYSFYIFI